MCRWHSANSRHRHTAARAAATIPRATQIVLCGNHANYRNARAEQFHSNASFYGLHDANAIVGSAGGRCDSPGQSANGRTGTICAGGHSGLRVARPAGFLNWLRPSGIHFWSRLNQLASSPPSGGCAAAAATARVARPSARWTQQSRGPVDCAWQPAGQMYLSASIWAALSSSCSARRTSSKRARRSSGRRRRFSAP